MVLFKNNSVYRLIYYILKNQFPHDKALWGNLFCGLQKVCCFFEHKIKMSIFALIIKWITNDMRRLDCIDSLLVVLLILAGCTQGSDSISESSEFPVSWNVYLEQSTNARALVDDVVLQTSCTKTTDETNESIGLWGQYTIGDQAVRVFEDTPLTYESGVWKYTGNTRYWRPGAVYDFRAYYPQSLMNELMTTKSATSFQGIINTSEVQEDILVTALQVDTKTANLYDAVPLKMHHVFAAIKFEVKAADGFTPPDGEGVTSCWLQNSATGLFSTSGTLIHSGNKTQEINWEAGTPTTGKMYLWKYQEGVSFSTKNTLYASIGNNGQENGVQYTKNDGWLLVVPQEVEAETLKLYYTLKKTPSEEYSVEIPAVTYQPGQRYTYTLEISGSDARLSLGILPWNEKELSSNIGPDDFEEKPVFKLVGNGPVKSRVNVKSDGLYLIYNPESGKYLYSNIQATKVDAGSSYEANGTIDPNYVWRFEKYYNYYFYVESMGELGHFFYCNQMTSNIVPLTHDVTLRGYFSLRDLDSNLRFLSSMSGLMFLAVINGVVCGTNAASSYVSHRNFELYEVVQEE